MITFLKHISKSNRPGEVCYWSLSTKYLPPYEGPDIEANENSTENMASPS